MSNVIKKTKNTEEKILNSLTKDVMCKTLRQDVKFKYQAGEIWDWIAQNRWINGEKWDWEYAQIAVNPGKEDFKHLDLYKKNGRYFLKRAPRPYLKQYINEKAPIKSCIKCRQSEFTENEINTNLFYTNTHKYFNSRHLFPTTGVARKVAKEKIDLAVHSSPYINSRLIPPKNITSKHFKGDSFYTVDGAYNEFGGRGPSSDRITYDEFNSHNPKIKEIYSSSTDHSKYGGQEVYISTPTFPNMGIDLEYQNGCQYSWYIQCPECKKQQTFLFPDNIINFIEKGQCTNREEEDIELENAYIGCRYCKAYINKTNEYYIDNSRWLARFPNIAEKHASYSVRGEMLPWVTGKSMNLWYLRMRFVNQFYNEKVGVSYIGDLNKVQKEDVEACQDYNFRNIMRRLDGIKNVSIGIDWGDKESWLIATGNGLGVSEEEMNKMRVIFVFRISDETLEKYGIEKGSDNHVKLAILVIDKLKPDIIINDANGIGLRDNATLYKKYKEKSFGSFYDTTEQRAELINKSSLMVRFNDKSGTVVIPRTVELSASMEDFIEDRVKIPKIETKTLWLFVEHICALATTNYYDEDKDRVIKIIGRTGPDHFAHAYTLSRVGHEHIKDDEPRKSKPNLKMSHNK